MASQIMFEDIAGHMNVKRAFEVAAAGVHSVLLVGPRGAGKATLLSAFKAFDHLPTCHKIQAVLCCWCGADDLMHACSCSKRAKERYTRHLRTMATDFDILVEVCPVPVKEFGVSPSMRETTADVVMRAQTAYARMMERGPQTMERLLKQLDDTGMRTFEMAARRLGLGCGEIVSMMSVARTIADLHGDVRIPARAVAEAAQYRFLCHLSFR